MKNSKYLDSLSVFGIDTTTIHFIKNRRKGSEIFRLGNGNFLRIGNKEVLEQERKLQQELLDFGFPLAKISHYDSDGEMSYFIEGSVGDTSLSRYFRQDCDSLGSISHKNLQSFLEMGIKFLIAQKVYIEKNKTIAEDFGKSVDILRSENTIPSDILEQFLEKAKAIQSTIPITWSHGDFNANNMFLGGVIDIEDYCFRGIGYDIISAITHFVWFPKNRQDFEFAQSWNFSEKQVKLLLQESSKHIDLNLENSLIFGLYFLQRGMFMCTNMSLFPKIREWRYEKWLHYVNLWLQGKNIYESFLKDISQ